MHLVGFITQKFTFIFIYLQEERKVHVFYITIRNGYTDATVWIDDALYVVPQPPSSHCSITVTVQRTEQKFAENSSGVSLLKFGHQRVFMPNYSYTKCHFKKSFFFDYKTGNTKAY
jgi:hypothetical protein